MKILLLGSQGLLGQPLQRELAQLGTVWSFARRDFPEIDFQQPEPLIALIRALRPNVIVNAAAFTDVDGAEWQALKAQQVNAHAVGLLAREAARLGSWLVHYSSDHVFNGSGTHFRDEEAALGPLNAYGRSKAEGEHLIRQSGCAHLILRTSGLYGPGGRHFARTVLQRARTQSSMAVVIDQIAAPTSAAWLARATCQALSPMRAQPALGGTYHAVAQGAVSRYDYAQALLTWATQRGWPLALSPVHLYRSTTQPQAGVAPRPLNGRLSTLKLQTALGITPPAWRDDALSALETMANEVMGPALAQDAAPRLPAHRQLTQPQ